MLKLTWLTLLLLLGLVPIVPITHAHELRPAIADLSVQDSRLAVTMRLNLEALIARIGPAHDDTDSSPDAERYNALRELSAADLQQQFEQFYVDWHNSLSVRVLPDTRLDLALANLQIPDTGDTRVARDSMLTLTSALPTGASALQWQWASRNGPVIVRFGAQDDANAFSQFVQPGESSDPITLDATPTRSVQDTLIDYLTVGFVHIVPRGLDHILFVVGLFLLAPRLKPILWQVSSFTLAHTITLALGVTGVVSITPAVIEPLIALSIAVIAVENLLTDRLHPWRPAVVFGFGLLHGLGFAGVLNDVGFSRSELIGALLAFNVGVELGQLCVIALCFLLVGWPLRHWRGYRRFITVPASLALAAIGVIWCVQRL